MLLRLDNEVSKLDDAETAVVKNDFRDRLPAYFQDVRRAPPLPEYVREGGAFNLVSRLPEFFARPELGPRLYAGYGLAGVEGVGGEDVEGSWAGGGTSGLRLEVSDCFSILAYVGADKDTECRTHQCGN